MPKVFRHERIAYLMVDASYEIMGEGITDWTYSANPKTSSSHYVHQQNASGGLSGYAPAITITAEGYSGDPVLDYIMDLGRTLAVGATALKKLCIYDSWTADKKAIEVDVVISIDNPGSGAAGEALAVTATLTFNGDITEGTFNPATKTFTAAAA